MFTRFRDLVNFDIDASRFEFAMTFCADRVHQLVPSSQSDSIQEAKQTAQDLHSSDPSIVQADIIFECTGAPLCLQTAVFVFLAVLI